MEALAEAAKASVEASAGTAVEAAVTAPTPTEKKWLKATVTVNLLFSISSRENYFYIGSFESAKITYV